jgi:hypothetical protein
LPADDANLETTFTGSNYTEVATDDDDYVSQTAVQEYPIFLFKKTFTNDWSFSITWKGKSNVSTYTNSVYLQIYNRDVASWEAVDSNSATAPGDEMIITGTISENLSNYFDESHVIACRVYQDK